MNARIAAAPAGASAALIPTNAPASSPTAAAPADFVANRMEATARWIESGVQNTYSIQLLVAADDQQLRNHLKALPKFIEANDIYMYRSTTQGRPMVNVLWGSFADRKAAQDELALLPASLRTNRPYVRTISGIRAEIDRQQGSARR